MKLRNLNGLIRKADDKITIKVTAPDGRPIPVRVPKSLLIEGLKDAYDGEEGTFETGLTLTDGVLVSSGDIQASQPITAPPATEIDLLVGDDDDLLGDDAGSLHTASAATDEVEDLLADDDIDLLAD